MLIVLPFTHYFARLIQWLVPSNETHLYTLDKSVLNKEPKLALVATQQAQLKIFQTTLQYIQSHLGEIEKTTVSLSRLEKSVEEVQEYLAQLRLKKSTEKNWQYLVVQLHGLNHLERLIDRCETMEKQRTAMRRSTEIQALLGYFLRQTDEVEKLLNDKLFTQASEVAHETSEKIISTLDTLRDEVILKIAQDELEDYIGFELLNTIKWFKRFVKHISKFSFYYERALQKGL